jgi:hypothetical protein
MKKSILSILSISVFSLVLFSLLLPGCRKPKCPEDPCKNPVTVLAVEQDFYLSGHFKLTNADNSETYLFATNWNQYATKVVPGRKYKIGYQEVACTNRDNEGQNGIREGGCVIYPNKCIRINCLEEVGQSCFDTDLSRVDFDNLYSSAIRTTGVDGSKLNATVSFSGCGPEDVKSFKLFGSELPDMSPSGHPIWVVKAVNTFDGVTCMAVFEKDICFDLTPIRNHYANTNGTKEVVVRMEIGSETHDFAYKF